MQKAYSRINWENYPSDNTPLNKTNLNKIDGAMDEIDNRVITQDTTKLDKTAANSLVKDVTFNEDTGEFTFTKYNGSQITINTNLEKLAVNFDYDSTNQRLVITLDDGTVKYVDMAALITQYEFIESDEIYFSITADGKVKASIKNGAITEDKLQPNYLADIKVQAETATNKAKESSDSASKANSYATEAESYAHGGTGTRQGEEIDNARYYYELAKSLSDALSKAGYVYSVNNKTGIVELTAGDVNAVPLSGGTMKGILNLYQQLRIADDLGVNKTVMQLFNPGPADTPQTYGSEVLFGAGGNMFIGAGESHTNLRKALIETPLDGETYSATGERMYVAADGAVYIYANVNNPEKRVAWVLSSNGHVYPMLTGQVSDLGTSAHPWRNVYASGAFIGELQGNAKGLSCTVVTTAGTDLNDYKTSGVFYFSSSYTPANIPGGVNGFLIVITNGNAVKQIWLRHGTNNSNDYHTWIRIYNGSAWSEWRRFLTDANMELYGKTAIFFGDSITWGERADKDGVRVTSPYPSVFGNITGATVINVGVRGATASTVQENSFAAQITANTDNIANADYCFVCFGVNDFSKNVDVGNELTTQSFYADYVAGINSIIEINPAIEIIIILPPPGKGATTKKYWTNDKGIKIDDYRDAVMDIAAKKRLRVVDFGKVGINADNAETYYPNGQNHLTQEGYTLFGSHLAKTYKTGVSTSKEEIYNKKFRVATNLLGTMPFPNPLETFSNTNYDGIYWKINGTDAAGITSLKNVQIIKDTRYHLEFLTYHRDNSNNRTATYTVTLTNSSDPNIKYTFNKTIKCIYERLVFDFYADKTTGYYNINIAVEGDNVYIASPTLSYDGIIPDPRKRRIGAVTFESTNTMTVYTNKFINGNFIFNVQVTADVSDKNLLRAKLNSTYGGEVSAYLPTENQYFSGVDLTDNVVVPMMWVHDSKNPGQYLLRLTTEKLTLGHKYAANGVLYFGRNDAVHEIIAQEY